MPNKTQPADSPPDAILTAENPMRILHVAAEAYPLVKTGGLADVASALPRAQRALGADARLLVPGYPDVLKLLRLNGTENDAIMIGNLFGAPNVKLLRAVMPDSNLPVIVIFSPWFYEREGNPYVDENGVSWADNHLRFGLLGWIAAHIAESQLIPDWSADILHAHDWHAGLSMSYLKQHPRSRTSRVFTIHNLAYQGRFSLQNAPMLMLDAQLLSPDRLEFHGDVSFMKAGIDGADLVTTVSPTYAGEILTPTFGEGLDGMLRSHRSRLIGILNGIDTQIWDPKTDPELRYRYDAQSITAKAQNKQALQRELAMPENGDRTPLIGIVSRLTPQKGQDLVLQALPELIRSNCQFVVLGTGDRQIEDAFFDYAEHHPANIRFVRGYDEALAHRIFGAADMILVPSRFEPCGLTQLYALRYGCIPIVRAVGGLADTVSDIDSKALQSGVPLESNTANGFTFTENKQFLPTMQRALRSYTNREQWQSIVSRAMQQDYGWHTAAGDYLRQYASIASRKSATT